MSQVHANQRLHANLTIQGNVQGVFFRDSARKLALSLGLSGYARNNPDGSLVIEIEGNEDSVSQFIDWAHTGPRKASVSHIHVEYGGLQYYDTFEVRY